MTLCWPSWSCSNTTGGDVAVHGTAECMFPMSHWLPCRLHFLVVPNRSLRQCNCNQMWKAVYVSGWGLGGVCVYRCTTGEGSLGKEGSSGRAGGAREGLYRCRTCQGLHLVNYELFDRRCRRHWGVCVACVVVQKHNVGRGGGVCRHLRGDAVFHCNFSVAFVLSGCVPCIRCCPPPPAGV
jgi:hypothetical protein